MLKINTSMKLKKSKSISKLNLKKSPKLVGL